MRRTIAALACTLGAISCSSATSSQSPSTGPSSTGDLQERIIPMTARQFEYSPSVVHAKKGQPVVFELTSQDRLHGFMLPDFGVRADVKAGETVRVRLVPDKTGTFVFHCDVFCGDGHEGMSGQLIVE
jgi:cytochrome c oxidase subunit 2